MAEEESNITSCNEEKKNSSDTKTTMFFIGDECEVKKTKQKPRKPPVLSSSLKKTTTSPITKDDLEKKLDEAAERRNKSYQLRAQRTAESRENLFQFAGKLEQLSALREKALQGQKFRNLEQNDKRMYVKLCKEISGQFEKLSSRYDRDIAMAGEVEECFAAINPTATQSVQAEPSNLKRVRNKNGAVLFTADTMDTKIHRKPGVKPVLSSSQREQSTPLSKEDIDRKLLQAEERRKKNFRTRSEHQKTNETL